MATAFYEFNADNQESVVLYSYALNTNISQAPETHIVLHFHTAVEFVFVESGRYRAWVDGDTFTLTRGDILFVDPHLPHSYESLGEANVYSVVISETLFERLHFPGKIPRIMRSENKSNPLALLFKDAAGVWATASEQYKLGFLYSLCGALLRFFPLQSANDQKREERFTDVLQYIEEHFREPITLDDLTQRFGYSKSYFSRMFNKITGANLREFLNRRRIAEALHIKENNPDLAWVHITVKVGFESWSTFSRAYKRYCGKNDLEEIEHETK